MAKTNQGTYFVAYRGKYIDPNEIERYMKKVTPQGFYWKQNNVVVDNSEKDLPFFLWEEGKDDIVIMGKIVPEYNYENREPYSYGSFGDELYTVSGYEQKELEDIYKKYYSRIYSITEKSFYHSLINQLIDDYDDEGLIQLANRGFNYCTAYYYDDNANIKTIAGFVSEPKGEFDHLYFGYPHIDSPNEIMISNSQQLILRFCVEGYELKPNHFVIDGKTFEVIDNVTCRSSIRDSVVRCVLSASNGIWYGTVPMPTIMENDLHEVSPELNSHSETPVDSDSNNNSTSTSSLTPEERAQRIMEIRRKMLEARRNREESDTTSKPDNENTNLKPPISTSIPLDNSIVEQGKSDIEKKLLAMLMPLILSDESKKKIKEFIEKDLDDVTKSKIEEIINEIIDNYNLDEDIESKISEIIDKKIKEYTSRIEIPTVNIIQVNNVETGRLEGELFHERFNDVLSSITLNEPVMLIGPAGSGKNHTIGQIAKGLGLHMYYTNCATNEFKLTGFIDAGGTYRDTEFYKAFKNGGLFFLDEIDNSDPSSLIVLNSALANGYMAYPHETIDRNPDFRMAAAANTFGKGSDIQYVGRNALDASTLDRFDDLFFGYDRKLEKALYPDDQVLEFMWALRDAVEETKIRHIVSTRGIGKLYKKAINNVPIPLALETAVIKNLRQDELDQLLNAMQIDQDNRYYRTAKTMRLGR